MAKVGAITRLPYNQAGVNLYTSEASVLRDAFSAPGALLFVSDYACTCRRPCMSGETEALAARLQRCGLDKMREWLQAPGRDEP